MNSEILEIYNEIINTTKELVDNKEKEILIYLEIKKFSSKRRVWYNYKNDKERYRSYKLVEENIRTHKEQQNFTKYLFNKGNELKEVYKKLGLPLWNTIVIRTNIDGTFEVDHYYNDSVALSLDYKIYDTDLYMEHRYFNEAPKGKKEEENIEKFDKGEIPVFQNPFTLVDIENGLKGEPGIDECLSLGVELEESDIKEIDRKLDLFLRGKDKYLTLNLEEFKGESDGYFEDFDAENNSAGRATLYVTLDPMYKEGMKYIIYKIIKSNLDKGLIVTLDRPGVLRIIKSEEFFIRGVISEMNIKNIEVGIPVSMAEDFYKSNTTNFAFKGNNCMMNIEWDIVSEEIEEDDDDDYEEIEDDI